MYNLLRTTSRLIQISVTKQAIRYKRGIPRKRSLVDPGIQNRKGIVDDDKEFEELDDYDFDLEADFMNVNKTHKQHEEEEIRKLERQKYLIVGRKYFKKKLPNFLTWSDKEQIRYLHNKDPDEWTTERLSEGFPALPDVIDKVVKSTWTKPENKIHNHDESVKENWKMFKEGSMKDLPPDLVEHLQKFTNRELSLKPFRAPNNFKQTGTKSMLAPNIKIGTEFSEIISSYKKLKSKEDDSKVNDNNERSFKSNVREVPKEDTYVLDGYSKMNKRHTTLSNLQESIEKRNQKGPVLAEEKLILNALKEEKQEIEKSNLQPTTEINLIVDNKYSTSKNSGAVTKFNENPNQASLVDYPNRIIIPKDKYKPGYTYKLNDCYYDDDGEFLYRVPGMYK